MNPRTAALLALPLLLVGLTGCDGSNAKAQADSHTPQRIVTTTPMLGDMVRNIVGDTAQVKALMGEGVDPHLYKPTRTDVEAISAADVVVTNGLYLEGRMQDTFDRAKKAGRVVIEVGESLPHGDLIHPEGAAAHPDPHVWMDPVLWGMCATTLAEALAKNDASHAETYRANAARYITEANALKARSAAAFESVPKDKRVLITAHDAFSYFGRRFSIEVHGIQGISTESEAGLADLERIVTLLVDRKVPAVFVESTVSPRTIEALVAGAKAKGHLVKIGGQLYSDSMGKAGTRDGTWVGMIEHNVRTIVEALGGTMVEAPGVAEAAHGH